MTDNPLFPFGDFAEAGADTVVVHFKDSSRVPGGSRPGR